MKLALGTVQFGLNYGVSNLSGRVSAEVAGDILNRARELGINTLDTAISYGCSELVLGSMGMQDFKIISKLPGIPEGCTDVVGWVKSQTQASLERLGIQRLYGLLLHYPSQLFERVGPELYAALQILKAEGCVEKIGVSVYGTAELEGLWSRYFFDLIQAPLNIIDRSLVNSGWADRLKDEGVEVHTRSAFLQGLMLIPKGCRPARFNHWADIWQEWDRWLGLTGLTPVQACLHYVNQFDAIDRVVVGVNSVKELEEIVAESDGILESMPAFRDLEDVRLINPATWNKL